MSFRDVEDVLAERRMDVSYETIRCWTMKFGPAVARVLSAQMHRSVGRGIRRAEWPVQKRPTIHLRRKVSVLRSPVELTVESGPWLLCGNRTIDVRSQHHR